MTYNVFSRTLNPTHFTSRDIVAGQGTSINWTRYCWLLLPDVVGGHFNQALVFSLLVKFVFFESLLLSAQVIDSPGRPTWLTWPAQVIDSRSWPTDSPGRPTQVTHMVYPGDWLT